MREETVTVKIDHPLGSTDEDNPSVVYPINCGYVDVERTAGFSELDKQKVYLLGVDVAVDVEAIRHLRRACGHGRHQAGQQ